MEQYKIKELDQYFKNCTYEEFNKFCLNIEDSRKGVINLIERYKKKFIKLNTELEEYNKRKKYESFLYKEGHKFIAGIDEVGRGPLAGPVYAAAVILNPEVDIIGIRDSKKLTENQREQLDEKIRNSALAYSVAYSTEDEIDRLNIFNATKLAMKRAIEGLSIKPEYILIDAVSLENISIPQISLIKGDDLSISIGAASIIAKVSRDKFMRELSYKYPQYLWDKNKGYGTKEHIKAIQEYGISDIHRKSFVRNFI